MNLNNLLIYRFSKQLKDLPVDLLHAKLLLKALDSLPLSLFDVYQDILLELNNFLNVNKRFKSRVCNGCDYLMFM